MEFPLLELIELAKKEDKSEDYIKNISSYVKQLTENNYPVIFTLEHFASLLKVQSHFLRYLLEYEKDSFSGYKSLFSGYILNNKYNRFNISKRSGGTRVILSPHEDLKYLQKWIQKNILNNFKLHENCKGFREGISIKNNANPHVNADLILKIDLLRFFDSIEEKRVYGCFAKMGYIGNLALDLARICTISHDDNYWVTLSNFERQKLLTKIEKGARVLPQGAPTSPVLANIIATRMDNRFSKLAEKLNFKYTRYADDLTFSIKGSGKLPTLSVIQRIIEQEGFILNHKKTRFSKKGTSQYVTGLSVSNGINLKKNYRKEIQRHIYFCKKYGVENHLKKKSELFGFNSISFHDWLYGHMCYIKSINPETFDKLFEDYKKIDWFI